jgi:hypothetical protein
MQKGASAGVRLLNDVFVGSNEGSHHLQIIWSNCLGQTMKYSISVKVDVFTGVVVDLCRKLHFWTQTVADLPPMLR